MKQLTAVLVFLVLVTPVFSQDYEWWEHGTYDPAVPTPKSVFGYEIGTFLTDHLQMVDYIHQLEKASSRVKVIKYGQSVEKRDMYLLVVASPENLARIEEIRQSIQRLADPRITSASEAEQIIKTTPPIAWLNYGTDGGETAAFETAIQMSYQLVAGTDDFTNRVLDNLVVIINPAACPDSHQAFVAWIKAATVGPQGTADPFANEHNMPWHISSDGNHYLIDFNRDAFALTQVEARSVAGVLHHWKPQVWVDNHGEPDEYYFAPFCTPMNRNYPDELRKWATELGQNCGKFFDRMGWSYARDETYDLFYPGYWDSYPAFNGAVSATFETNGGGSKHLSWEKPDGSISTLRLAVHGHFMTNMATLDLLVQNREEIFRYFRHFYQSGMEEVKTEKVKGYVLYPGTDRARLLDLVSLLMRHEIEVYEINSNVSFEKGRKLMEETFGQLEIPAGSYLVPLEQPRKRLAKALFEPTPEIEEQFLEEVERLRKVNRTLGDQVPGERLGFYDVTSWSLPLIFGLDAAEIESDIPVENFQRIEEKPVSPGRVEQRAEYAYIFSGSSVAGSALAGQLLQKGFNVGVTTRGFENAGKSWQAGDFIVRVKRNPETLHKQIAKLADDTGAEVLATNSSGSARGISLGSRRIVDLKEPRIMVLAGDPTRAVAFGAVYSVLEQRFGLKFTAVRFDYFDEVDLSRYNVIILPDGSASGYRKYLGESGSEKLLSWIRNGGVAIGLKEGARYFTLGEDSPVDVSFVSSFRESEEGPELPIEMHSGSIFKADVNSDYFLGYGHVSPIPVQVRGSRLMNPTRNGVNVVSFLPDSHLGGHKWEYTEKILEGKSYLADVPVGQGRILLFAEDPTFRAYWRGLDQLFINGVILGPSF
jgi:Zinc carboxypeptidase